MKTSDSSRVLQAGIFLISFSMLMFQVLLTRIFSVTVYYHFAFLAVTIAMFGLTLGAVVVTLNPNVFTLQNNRKNMGWASLGFAWFALISLLIHVKVNVPSFSSAFAVLTHTSVLLILVAAFTSGGVCICLCLTHYPKIVGKLYATDLLGSAIGSLSVLWIMPHINGPACICVVFGFACLSTLSFWRSIATKVGMGAVTLCLVLCTFIFCFDLTRPIENSIFKLTWAKGDKDEPALFERWNSYSRVTVKPGPKVPFGWGLSNKYRPDTQADQLYLEIDAGASTPITKFTGDFKGLEYLKADITNLAHYLRPSADVFVVGVGGARDILSALMFEPRSITGAEINPNIIQAVSNNFAKYDGNITIRPNVTVVNDEARSYISRQNSKFDIIQISLVDTFAAAASGAFVLSENALYTSEAFNRFLVHLTPHGILSVSRWWVQDYPVEAYRTVALARAALIKTGVTNPARNIIVIVNSDPLYRSNSGRGVVTVLTSIDPFSEQDISNISAVSEKMNFEVKYAPGMISDHDFSVLINEPGEQASTELSMQLNPPTDRAPFFFQLARPQEIMLGRKTDTPSAQISKILIGLVVALLILSYFFLVRPLRTAVDKQISFSIKRPFMIFFIAIGCGFMFIEVSLMQWFSTFLGQPTFGISVVLFTLLLSTGVGSFITNLISIDYVKWVAILIVLLGAIVGLFLPDISASYRDSDLSIRIVVAILTISPLGISMGLGFPLGMRLAQNRLSQCKSILWGLNGAASVCTSSLAVLVSIFFSIWSTYWCGIISYILAASCLWNIDVSTRQRLKF